MKPTPEPYNVNEKYLHGINVRLEVLIEQMSGLLEHIAKRDQIATTSAITEMKVVKKSPTKSKE